jgi:hypothetical protein
VLVPGSSELGAGGRPPFTRRSHFTVRAKVGVVGASEAAEHQKRATVNAQQYSASARVQGGVGSAKCPEADGGSVGPRDLLQTVPAEKPFVFQAVFR